MSYGVKLLRALIFGRRRKALLKDLEEILRPFSDDCPSDAIRAFANILREERQS